MPESRGFPVVDSVAQKHVESVPASSRLDFRTSIHILVLVVQLLVLLLLFSELV